MANVFIGLTAVVSSSCLARGLGPGGRVTFAAACIWPSLILSLGAIINTQSVTYFWSKKKDTPLAAAALSAAILLASVLSVLLLPLGWLVNSIALSESPALAAANVYTWSIPLSLITGCILGFFLAEERFGIYWTVRISTAVFYAGGMIVMFAAGALTVARAVFVALLSLVASTAISAMIFRTGRRFQPAWDSSLFSGMLAFGARVNFAAIPYQLNLRLDQLLMSILLTPAVLGFYSSAFSWSSMLILVGNGISVVMLARSSRMDPGDRAGVRALLSLFRLISCALILMGLLLAAVTPLVLPLLFGSEFWPAVAPAVVLCVAGIFLNINVVLHEMTRGLGFPELGVRAEFLGLILTSVLLLLLLPRWQGMGAAVASLASYGAVLFALVFQLSRKIKEPVSAFAMLTRKDLEQIPVQLARVLSLTRPPVSAGDS